MPRTGTWTRRLGEAIRAQDSNSSGIGGFAFGGLNWNATMLCAFLYTNRLRWRNAMVRSSDSQAVLQRSELCIRDSLASLTRIQAGISQTSKRVRTSLDALNQSEQAIQQIGKLLNGHGENLRPAE